MADSSDFEEGYRELREQYAERTLGRLDRIGKLLEDSEDSRADAFEEIARIVHRLAGSGETMGFPKVSELSIDLEERLDAIDDPVDGGWRDEVEVYCRRVRAALE